jgi:hypothetical protein
LPARREQSYFFFFTSNPDETDKIGFPFFFCYSLFKEVRAIAVLEFYGKMILSSIY